MSMGFYAERRRRQRRRQWLLVKWLAALLLVGWAGYQAYRTGSELAARQVIALEQEIARLSATSAALQAENDALRQDLAAVQSQAASWQARYDEEVPQGKIRELLQAARGKLEEGIEAERLAFVIDSIRRDRDCEADAATKRFIVRTPLYDGGNDVVAFGDSAVTVTAQGAHSTNAAGNAEAWFDPAKPVTVAFTDIGGRTTEKTGVLPLHHSLVVGGHEYRFAVVPAQRAFVEVSAQRCRFP